MAGAFLLKFLVPAPSFDAAPAARRPSAPASVGQGHPDRGAGTFFLVWAVFATAVDDRGPFGKTAGLTIGLSIAFGILAIGPWTGAAMNPARWFGPALASGQWDDWCVWIVGPMAGAIVAGVAYWGLFLRDKEPATP